MDSRATQQGNLSLYVYVVYWLPLASQELLLTRKCNWPAERMLIGTLRYRQRTTSRLKLYKTLYRRLNVNHFLSKARSQHKMFLYTSSYAFILLCWQYWWLTDLHILMSILLTVVTRTTTENPVFCLYFVSSNQIKNGSVQTNNAILNLIDNF